MQGDINQFSRTELIFGKEKMDVFKKSRIAVFGIGGVGGYVVEALARNGIGTLDLIDNDRISVTNINRQIIATFKTIGMYKVDAEKERLLDINPEVIVNKYKTFYMPDTSNQFNFSVYDYIVDAIDTVTGKIEIIINAEKAGVPVISCMGAGNKLNPADFEVSDIYKTSVCPLAKVMRRELKKRGVKKLKVVYSKETPLIPLESSEGKLSDVRKKIPGSVSFVPSVAGLIIAGEVLKDISKKGEREI